jgi:predicted ABC-type sugar transport system permease subunit
MLMKPHTVYDQPSQLRIPAWIAVLAIAVVLAMWTFVFAQLIGDHVAALSGSHAAAALTGHGSPGGRPA